jgi:hypothetical protein
MVEFDRRPFSSTPSNCTPMMSIIIVGPTTKNCELAAVATTQAQLCQSTYIEVVWSSMRGIPSMLSQHTSETTSFKVATLVWQSRLSRNVRARAFIVTHNRAHQGVTTWQAGRYSSLHVYAFRQSVPPPPMSIVRVEASISDAQSNMRDLKSTPSGPTRLNVHSSTATM